MNSFDDFMKGLVARYADAVENLTREQLETALRQAFASGDFMRVVEHGSNAQQVTYIPFREVEQLRLQLAHVNEVAAQIFDRCDQASHGLPSGHVFDRDVSVPIPSGVLRALAEVLGHKRAQEDGLSLTEIETRATKLIVDTDDHRNNYVEVFEDEQGLYLTLDARELRVDELEQLLRILSRRVG